MKKSKIVKIIWILIFLSIFFFLAFSINTSYIEKFDTYIYELTQTINNKSVTDFFKVITNLAGPLFVIVILLLCMIFIKDKKIKKIILLNAILIITLNQIIKFIVARPRPEDIMQITEYGFSFPSAHSMFVLAFYGMFIYLIHKSNMRKKNKAVLDIILGMVIIIIPITRIYLGVHYASDVIAGLCLSSAILLIYSLFKEEKDRKN